MSSARPCLVCGGSTETGFVLDKGDHNSRTQQEWWQGPPERSFWVGIKKPERTYKITAMRCTKCGYVMEFAQPDEGGMS